jgi:hypothetical protein
MTAAERTKTMQLGSIAHLRIVSLPVVIVGIGYLAVYVLVDWISFIEPAQNVRGSDESDALTLPRPLNGSHFPAVSAAAEERVAAV